MRLDDGYIRLYKSQFDRVSSKTVHSCKIKESGYAPASFHLTNIDKYLDFLNVIQFHHLRMTNDTNFDVTEDETNTCEWWFEMVIAESWFYALYVTGYSGPWNTRYITYLCYWAPLFIMMNNRII